MLLAALQFQRIPSIVHFLRGRCVVDALGKSYQYDECAVELGSARIDHFNASQPEKLTVTGPLGQRVACLSGRPCEASGTQLGVLGMCQFGGFAMASNLTHRLQMPVRFDRISREVIVLNASECGASIRISGLHYGQRRYSYAELLQIAALIIALHVAAMFYALRAALFFMENQALAGELPQQIMTLQINCQQILIFMIADSGDGKHGFAKLHLFYIALAMTIHIPGLVITTLLIFRTNGLRDIVGHTVKSALLLLSKMWFILLYTLLQFGASQLNKFLFVQTLVCCAVVQYAALCKASYGHQIYGRFLLLDICRSEALLMYYFGFDSYLGGSPNRAYAAAAYLVAIFALWRFAQKRAVQRSPVHYQANFSTDIVVFPLNCQEFEPRQGIPGADGDVFAVAVQDCALQCQNPLHVHATAAGRRKQLPPQLKGVNLAEFDSRCYVLVSEEFFHQLCPICLEEMQFQLEQLAVCRMKSDRDAEVRYLSGRLGLQPDDGALAQLRCGHVFHVRCILAWLGEKSACPKCRCPTG